MSFSAWGGRREANTWLPPVGAAETQADHNANRYGFTHHEMLDNVGIINMNGRIYDPNLGRFLSVDPVFAFPTNTQSLNPYSYVLNNPLSLTDPTGYAACSDVSVKNGHDAGMCSFTDKDGNKAWVGYNVHSNGDVSLNTADLKAAMPVIANTGSNGVSSSAGTNSTQTMAAGHTDISSPKEAGTSMNGVQITGGMKPLSDWHNWLDTNPLGQMVNGLGDQLAWIGSAFNHGQAVNPFSNEDVTGERLFNAKILLLTAIIPAGRAAPLEENIAKGLENAVSRALTTYYPNASGFLGSTTRAVLEKGATIDRYGGEAISRFFSPAGTPSGMRALPSETALQRLRSFEVLKPFEVETGRTAPAFGQPGLGIQYKSRLTLDELLGQGYVREKQP